MSFVRSSTRRLPNLLNHSLIHPNLKGLRLKSSTSLPSASENFDHGLRRSYLYVPASSDRTLQKSLTSESDMIIYDLEDSVPPTPHDKLGARQRLVHFLDAFQTSLPRSDRIAVRLNDIRTPFFQQDISEILKFPCVRTFILPKIHSALDLHHISRAIHILSDSQSTNSMRLVASIESARGTWNIGEIASWRSEHGPWAGGFLSALLFAAEDYCADTSVIRTPSRQELLFVRSQIVVAAKTFGLDAIDMVCVNYKDLEYLRDECKDGRRLGFNGKQVIHPSQVEVVQSEFVPTAKEILRAAKILHQMNVAHSSQKGAFGLEMEDGGREMIDAPMLKQAEKVILLSKAAGLEIPDVS